MVITFGKVYNYEKRFAVCIFALPDTVVWHRTPSHRRSYPRRAFRKAADRRSDGVSELPPPALSITFHRDRRGIMRRIVCGQPVAIRMYTSVFAKINFRPHRNLRRSPALRDNSAEVFILRSLLSPRSDHLAEHHEHGYRDHAKQGVHQC